MLTFKKFLEETTYIPLEWLPWTLFFRKEVHLTREAAIDAVDWVRRAGTRSAPDPEHMAEDGWDHIIDWADEQQKKEGKPSIYELPLSHELAIKGIIAKVARDKYRLEIADIPEYTSEEVSQHALDDLQLELFFRKEFHASKAQAKELVAWFIDDKELTDLEHDAERIIHDRWHPGELTDRHPGMSYGDHVMDRVALIMKDRYKMDARDYIR